MKICYVVNQFEIISNFSVVFESQIPLSAKECLWLTPWHLFINWKICGIWAKFSQLMKKICENLKFERNSDKSENFAQIPQIFQLMKRCHGVNHKHSFAESGIWLSNTTETLPEAHRTQKLTWTKLGNMAPLALIANLATRWHHLTFSH